MKKYYFYTPRGFGNEFSIISIDQKNPYETTLFDAFYYNYLCEGSPDKKLFRVGAKEARKIVAGERRLKRNLDSAGLDGIVGATRIITATEFFEE